MVSFALFVFLQAVSHPVAPVNVMSLENPLYNDHVTVLPQWRQPVALNEITHRHVEQQTYGIRVRKVKANRFRKGSLAISGLQ